MANKTHYWHQLCHRAVSITFLNHMHRQLWSKQLSTLTVFIATAYSSYTRKMLPNLPAVQSNYSYKIMAYCSVMLPVSTLSPILYQNGLTSLLLMQCTSIRPLLIFHTKVGNTRLQMLYLSKTYFICQWMICLMQFGMVLKCYHAGCFHLR